MTAWRSCSDLLLDFNPLVLVQQRLPLLLESTSMHKDQMSSSLKVCLQRVCASTQYVSSRFSCDRVKEQTLPLQHLGNKLPRRVLSCGKWLITPKTLQKTTALCITLSSRELLVSPAPPLLLAVGQLKGPKRFGQLRVVTAATEKSQSRLTVMWAFGCVHILITWLWHCNDISGLSTMMKIRRLYVTWCPWLRVESGASSLLHHLFNVQHLGSVWWTLGG